MIDLRKIPFVKDHPEEYQLISDFDLRVVIAHRISEHVATAALVYSCQITNTLDRAMTDLWIKALFEEKKVSFYSLALQVLKKMESDAENRVTYHVDLRDTEWAKHQSDRVEISLQKFLKNFKKVWDRYFEIKIQVMSSFTSLGISLEIKT